MPDIRIENNQLHVEMNLLETIVGFKRALHIPLNKVDTIRRKDVSLGASLSRIRFPGTHVPGFIRAGTYFQDDERVFWHVRRGQEAVEIVLNNADYDRVIVGVDNADRVMAQYPGK